MYLRHLVIMPEGFHPFPSRTRKLRPPGPMILGAQAPGKVGHRQVTNEKTISYEVVFSVFCVVGQYWVPHCRSVRYGTQCGEKLVRFSCSIQTAGVCVLGCSVAKGSSAFRSRANETWGTSPTCCRIFRVLSCYLVRSH